MPVTPLTMVAAVESGELLAARSQMAFTLGFHIIFACLGVGLPVVMLVAERMFLRTGDESWRQLARRWSRAFAVLFAVGAVSGTVVSFEMGLLWPGFMGTFGSVIGLPFTLEGFAFFLEAIFLGIYLYGWERLSPRAHWWSGMPIVVAGVASAWFVVTANAWMNHPQGFTLVDGRVVDVSPVRAMLNPATWSQTTHMIVAAYMVTGFLVAAVYAGAALRGGNSTYVRRAMALGIVMGAAFAPIQVVVGDWSARVVANSQPVKFAAMEGIVVTEAGAALRIGPFAIPGGASLLLHGDCHAVIPGLDAVPESERPPDAIVHAGFLVMVGIGFGLLFIALWSGWSWWRHRRLPEHRAYWWALVAAGPAAVLALEAGWVVTEVGRQPWIAQGVMRTIDAVTSAPGVSWVFVAVVGVYAVLATSTVVVLRILAKRPIEAEEKADVG